MEMRTVHVCSGYIQINILLLAVVSNTGSLRQIYPPFHNARNTTAILQPYSKDLTNHEISQVKDNPSNQCPYRPIHPS
jgi:hypothetical protein